MQNYLASLVTVWGAKFFFFLIGAPHHFSCNKGVAWQQVGGWFERRSIFRMLPPCGVDSKLENILSMTKVGLESSLFKLVQKRQSEHFWNLSRLSWLKWLLDLCLALSPSNIKQSLNFHWSTHFTTIKRFNIQDIAGTCLPTLMVFIL